MSIRILNTFHPANLIKRFVENPPTNIIIVWLGPDGSFHTESKVDDVITAIGMLELAKDDMKYEEE